MREIKFRFWDPFQKTMSQEHDWHGLLVCEGDTLPLQFTGLKDKNGKEIYEGDILQDNTWSVPRVVKWEDGCFIAEPGLNEPQLGLHAIDRKVDSVEVIGNIYENPELLKES